MQEANPVPMGPRVSSLFACAGGNLEVTTVIVSRAEWDSLPDSTRELFSVAAAPAAWPLLPGDWLLAVRLTGF